MSCSSEDLRLQLKYSIKAASSEGLTGTEGSSVTGLLAGVLSLSHHGFSMGLLGCSYNVAAGLSRTSDLRENKKEDLLLSYDLVSKVAHCHLHFILWTKNESQVQTTLKGKGISVHLLKGRPSKNLWTYFKTITHPCEVVVVIPYSQ